MPCSASVDCLSKRHVRNSLSSAGSALSTGLSTQGTQRLNDIGFQEAEGFRSGPVSVSKANLKSEGAIHRQLVHLAPFALPLPHYLPPILYLRQRTAPIGIAHDPQRRPFAHAQARAGLGRKHVLQIEVDRVRREVLVRRHLHPLLGEEDEAAHGTLEFGRVRGGKWLEVVAGVVNRSGLFGWRGCEKAEDRGTRSGGDGIRGPKSGIVKRHGCVLPT